MRRGVWLAAVLLVALIAGCPKSGGVAGPSTAETWLENFVVDKRVGYSVYRFDRVGEDYRFDSYIRMTLAMAEKTQRVHSRATVTTGPDLTMKEFEFSFSSQDRSFKVTGKVEGLKLTVTPAGGRPRETDLKGPVFPVAALGRMVATTQLGKDSVFKLPVFDVSVLDAVQAEVRVLGKDTVRLGENEHEAVKYTTRMAKLTMTSWVDEQGMVIREEAPPTMVSVRASAKEVLSNETGDAKVDILMMFRVPAETTIAEPEAVRYAKIAVSGIEESEYEFAGDYQKVTGGEPFTVEVTTPALPAEPTALPVAGQDEFLKPTVSIQCDDAGIKAKSKEALGQVTDAKEAAEKLVSWTFTVMEKEATASFPTAVDVLGTLKGDCNEHAVLYAALARAAGIPTKVTVGLVFLNGAFYYHAWNEVFLGGWIPVDPTFGEFPASALHVKLAEGELSRQADVLALVGRVKMKVLAFDTKQR